MVNEITSKPIAHIASTGGTHPLPYHFRLFHNLFHGELADNSAQMPFHHQADQAFPLRRSLAEELLGGRKD